MAIPQIFMQISAARERGDLKTVRRLFKSVEKGYGDNSYFLFEKGMFELLNGANKKTVVLPLFEKAYRCGLNENFDFLFRFGMLLYELGIYATSAEVLGKAIAIKPDHVGVLGYLACVFEKTGNPVTATNTYKIALKIEPRNISINFNIAGTLMVCGYQEEALEAYKKAVECIKEDSLRLTNAYNYSNYLFYSNYVEMNRDEYFALCQKYRTIWENEIPNIRPIFPETEKIKIGFVSGDFYFMAVSFFVSSLFENYDKNKFEFHLFSTLAREKYDKNTKMFMEQTDKWHDIAKLNVNDVVNLIKKEKITVLVDLSGHTGGNGLLIFGRRPAPIQINYCGYPNTTGLKSIDYRITDNVCEPDDAQNYHSEKLFKM
ncbi:MAG: hypothetical protein LBH98_08905, partial [Chitinispirillales bacterium]|nr:hypothetical protein [Chitinispirillales bacterium]